jgi:hypothetical protein
LENGEHEGMVVPIVEAGALHSMLGICPSLHRDTRNNDKESKRRSEKENKKKLLT